MQKINITIGILFTIGCVMLIENGLGVAVWG